MIRQRLASPRAWAIAGAAVSMALAVALFDPYLFTGGDNAAYYALSRALATGRGYVDIVHPDAPLETLYPPGFPLLLVPFQWLFGGSFVGLKVESLLAGATVLWAIWSLARRDRAVAPWIAAAAVWLVGLYPVFLEYTKWVLSDMSYTAVALVALWAFARDGDDPVEDRPDRGWVAACLLAVAAFYVRTAGVALLAAVVAVEALRRRWRRAGLSAALFAVTTGPWFLWSRLAAGDEVTYVRQLSRENRLDPESGAISLLDYVARAWNTALDYATIEFPHLFWPTDPPLAIRSFGLLIGGALLVWGVVRCLRAREVAVHDAYALFTLGVLALWPWRGDRMFLTVAPVLWLYVLVGLDGISRLLAGSTKPARVAAGLVAALLLVGGVRAVPGQWRLVRAYLAGEELAGYHPFWQDYFEASAWIGENAPDAVITARKPTFAWYWSGRPSVVYPFHGDPDRTWGFLRETGVTHIVLEPMTRAFLQETLAAHVDALEVIHSAPNRFVYVLRIAPGP